MVVSNEPLVQYWRISNRAILHPGRDWVLNQLESNETGAVGAVREPATSWRELYHMLTVTDFVQDLDLLDGTSLDPVCVESCRPGLR